jgi:hypothetical protein
MVAGIVGLVPFALIAVAVYIGVRLAIRKRE